MCSAQEAGLATMDVGEIESLLGDGVGIRYQIFGPGSALATAGSSVARSRDLAALGAKSCIGKNGAVKISEPGAHSNDLFGFIYMDVF